MKRSKYKVQLKDGRKWVDTEWTNPNPSEPPAPINPLPVTKGLALRALKKATTSHPWREYKIVEVGS